MITTTAAYDDRDALIGAILKQKEDWPRYLILADWLEKNDEVRLAMAYRWMAAWRKYPCKRSRYFHAGYYGRWVADNVSWVWYAPWSTPRDCIVKEIPEHAVLPRPVYYAVGRTGKQKLTWSWNAAVVLLAIGLADLAEAIATERKG